MTVEEVRAVLARLDGVEALVAGVLYGGGLRLMEALRLRVHDLDFQRSQITVRHGKGGKDRRTMLPARMAEKLKRHLEEVRSLHRQDLAEGYGRVLLPHALGRKYPHAPVEWRWQWVFPQQHRWHNPNTGEQGGPRLWDHHACHESHVPPSICHPPTGTRPRYTHYSGITRAQRYKNHNDLHPRA